MTTVYWSVDEGDIPEAVHEPLRYSLISEFDNFDEMEKHLMRCPAIRDFYQSLIPLKSIVPFKIEGGVLSHKRPDDEKRKMPIDTFFNVVGPDLVFGKPSIYLFADNPCRLQLLPPVSQFSEYASNTHTVCGEMDISKWFRPVHPAFHVRPGASFCVERGDTLCNLKLSAEDKITLKHFEWTPELRQLRAAIQNVKDVPSNFRTSLKNYYDIFKTWNYRSKLLKELQKQ